MVRHGLNEEKDVAKEEGDGPTQDWLDQKDHERMKVWMIEHHWSFSIFCFDPADVYEILEALDVDDMDIDDIIETLNNLHKDQ